MSEQFRGLAVGVANMKASQHEGQANMKASQPEGQPT
jgi:hypothetical protein